MPNVKTNSNHGTLYIAGFTATLAGGPTVTAPSGRTYSGTTITVDRSNLDFRYLLSVGWVALFSATGTTSARPVDLENGNPIPNGFLYYDTTLSALITKCANGWVNATTGAAV